MRNLSSLTTRGSPPRSLMAASVSSISRVAFGIVKRFLFFSSSAALWKDKRFGKRSDLILGSDQVPALTLGLHEIRPNLFLLLVERLMGLRDP